MQQSLVLSSDVKRSGVFSTVKELSHTVQLLTEDVIDPDRQGNTHLDFLPDQSVPQIGPILTEVSDERK